MEYTGERNIKGEPNGQGTYTHPDGTTSTGEFKDGKRNGQAGMKYADCDTYIGEWKDGLFNGIGIETAGPVAAYKGEWKDNKRHGRGVGIDADGTTYTGEWKDDKAPAGAKLFTAADLQQLESEGWDGFTIQYVDYSLDNQKGHKLW